MTTSAQFCEWAARSLLDQLRRGDHIQVEASSFVWEPMLSALRSAAGSDDVDLVLALLADDRLRMFGGLLSRAVLEDERVTSALLDCFASELDEERQLGLFHQLVARRLDSNSSELLSTWAVSHAQALIAEQRAFFLGQDAVARLEHRMTAPEFAEKRWVYLYSAHALEDPQLVREFVARHTDPDDPRMTQAAEASLSHLVD